MATQAERSAATTAAILAAARKLFAEDGFVATSVDRIVAEAGVAKGAFYHHFDSKEEVFLAVLEEAQSALAVEVVRAAAAGKDPLARVKVGCRAFLAACVKPAVRRIVLLDGPAVAGWDAWREIDSRHFGAMLREGLRAATNEAAIQRRPIEPLVHVLLGAITEAAMVCARAADPNRAVRQMSNELERLIDRLHLD